MKRAFAAALLTAALLVPATAPADAAKGKFVAATYSDRYHLPECKVVRKIDQEDMVWFATPEEAIAAGYVPCKKCNPPDKSVKRR